MHFQCFYFSLISILVFFRKWMGKLTYEIVLSKCKRCVSLSLKFRAGIYEILLANENVFLIKLIDSFYMLLSLQRFKYPVFIQVFCNFGTKRTRRYKFPATIIYWKKSISLMHLVALYHPLWLVLQSLWDYF